MDEENTKKKKMDEENTKKKYGKCEWSDDYKRDVKGSNCPEYLFIHIFMKGMWK